MFCSVEGCGKDVHSKGMCQSHYRYLQRHGSLEQVPRAKPGPKQDPSKPYSKYKTPVPRKLKTHCPQGHEYTEENTYVYNGVRSCKVCRKTKTKAYRKSPHGPTVVNGKKYPNGIGVTNALKTHCPKGHEYTLENTSLTKAGSRVCRECNRINLRIQNKKRYGISIEEYDAMLFLQEGKCAICKRVFNNEVKAPHIDHDHMCCPGERSCGKCVRGLLCGKCNSAIGLLEDSAESARAAVDYLTKVVLR